MSLPPALRWLGQSGRWVYLFYTFTLLAIAGGWVSLGALGQGDFGVWIYLCSALVLLCWGVGAGRRLSQDVGTWLWVLLSCVMAGVGLLGGLQSPYYPIVYLFWVAVPSWIGSQRKGVLLALGYLGLELALWACSGPGSWLSVLEHLVFCGLFWATHRLVLGGALKLLAREQQDALRKQEDDFVRAAQDFRLEGSAKGSSQDAQRASVASIHGTIEFELALLRESLGVHSMLLVWPQESQGTRTWSIKAHRSASALRSHEDLCLEPLLAPLQRGEAVLRLQGGIAPRQRAYYQDPNLEIECLCAVGLLDQGQPCGALVADRRQGPPFSQAEVEILKRAGLHLTRCVAQERAFLQVDRQYQMHASLHAASVKLSQALGSAQLQQCSLEALSMILPNDLALLFAQAPGAEGSVSLLAQRAGQGLPSRWRSCISSWSSTPLPVEHAGMVGSALKTRAVIVPKRPDCAPEGLRLFGDAARLVGAQSVVALPLVHADHCDAVVVVVCRGPDAYEEQDLSSAGILVHQIGAAMQNARLYDQMQQQATTDGLTGLANHRTFQARLEESVAQARRNATALSLILCDIDHFKQVNDRYGHPVGDEVLRAVAKILERAARKYDLVARYGGEEFVLLLPGSDAQAALALAERLRIEVAQEGMQGNGQSFAVTLSLGIAQWQGPQDDRQALIDRADKALYACKGAGRNCVRDFADL